MNYIGMDSHISTLDFKVVSETGKVIRAQRVEINASNLLRFGVFSIRTNLVLV